MEVFSAQSSVRKRHGRGRPRKQLNIGVTVAEAIKIPYVVKQDSEYSIEAFSQPYNHFKVPPDSAGYNPHQKVSQIHESLLSAKEYYRSRQVLSAAVTASDERAFLQKTLKDANLFKSIASDTRSRARAARAEDDQFRDAFLQHLDTSRIDLALFHASALPFTEITPFTLELAYQVFAKATP